MALVTAAQVRTAGVPQVTGTGEDTTLDTLIGQAEAMIAQWLGWPRADSGAWRLDSTTYTLYLDGPSFSRPAELVLPIAPVSAITSIYDDPTRAYAASSLVSSGDYTLDAARGCVVADDGCGWSTAYRALKVTCTAGWSTAPGEVVQAVALQTRALLDYRRLGTATQQTQGGQTVTVAVPSGITQRAAALLWPHRQPRVLVG